MGTSQSTLQLEPRTLSTGKRVGETPEDPILIDAPSAASKQRIAKLTISIVEFEPTGARILTFPGRPFCCCALSFFRTCWHRDFSAITQAQPLIYSLISQWHPHPHPLHILLSLLPFRPRSKPRIRKNAYSSRNAWPNSKRPTKPHLNAKS